MKGYVAVMFLAVWVACTRAGSGADLVLAERGGSSIPIILPAGAPAATVAAAGELAGYIEKMAGVRPAVLTGAPEPVPASALWVGFQPALAALFPKTDFTLRYPEEILMACDGRHVAVLGRDRLTGTNQLEYGTANAVYTFVEKHLGVRWLWPDELGTDIPTSDRIDLKPFEYRFHPPFRNRWLWPQRDREWNLHQRLLLGSYPVTTGHAYEKWWEDYHAEHPDYFALQPNGKRDFSAQPKDAKLCVSNPRVSEQWIENAVKAFAGDPLRVMCSATPNDGPYFCTCTNCRAWDPTNAPATTMYGIGGSYVAPALSDRYVKYWNGLARALRERVPEREAYVGAAAYSAYRTPPVREALERNIAVSYVGHFPLAGDETTQSEKAAWLGWADKASVMLFRPNLFHYSGGWLGLPTLALQRTMRDFRFLADHKCVGIEVDTLPLDWATQGVQYYLLAQVTYDPYQDGEAVLTDYCRRGFGPAAGPVADYFDLMEKAHEAILGRIKHSGAAAREMIGICHDVYTEAVMKQADALMRKAEARVAKGPEVYRKRVAFLATGHEYVALQVGIIAAMKRARESAGKDAEAVRRAQELCDRREALLKANPGIAFRRADWYHTSRKLDDYMGPPSATLKQAAGADSHLPGFEARD